MKTSFLTSAGAIVFLGLTVFPFISHGEPKPSTSPDTVKELSTEVQNNPDVKAYKASFYKIIGANWYKHVKKPDDRLKAEKIEVRFFIKPDGTLGDILLTKGDPKSWFSQLTLKSIKETSGKLPPFPKEISNLLGQGYWDVVTFDIN